MSDHQWVQLFFRADDEKILESDSCDGCTTVNTTEYQKPVNYILSMSKLYEM